VECEENISIVPDIFPAGRFMKSETEPDDRTPAQQQLKKKTEYFQQVGMPPHQAYPPPENNNCLLFVIHTHQ